MTRKIGKHPALAAPYTGTFHPMRMRKGYVAHASVMAVDGDHYATMINLDEARTMAFMAATAPDTYSVGPDEIARALLGEPSTYTEHA